MTMIAAVVLLSGCAYGSYDVRMGVADGESLTYREKRGVDSELAEDGRSWSNAEPNLAVGSCAFYRRKGVFLGNPPPDAHQYKEDIDCTVWNATKGREHNPRWYLF
jgi:hypothetical protein